MAKLFPIAGGQKLQEANDQIVKELSGHKAKQKVVLER
jgi:hypothetical protein